MKKTFKIKLNPKDIHSFAVGIVCCNERRWFTREDYEPCYMWHCLHCGELMLVVDQKGIPHYVGRRVFE